MTRNRSCCGQFACSKRLAKHKQPTPERCSSPAIDQRAVFQSSQTNKSTYHIDPSAPFHRYLFVMLTLNLYTTCLYILIFGCIDSGIIWRFSFYLLFRLPLNLSFATVLAIKCYQCSTEKDGKGADNCGAYASFDKSQNIAVDCMGEEAVTPGEWSTMISYLNLVTVTNCRVALGTFCFKSIQQGPRGFIWDGRWRSVIRRCAQVSERGE